MVVAMLRNMWAMTQIQERIRGQQLLLSSGCYDVCRHQNSLDVTVTERQ